MNSENGLIPCPGMYTAVAVLKDRLLAHGQLEVFHGSYSWKASFHWMPPATNRAISDYQARLDVKLPEDFCCFLANVSNGAILFYDSIYGQWGYKLYSIEELLEKQNLWKNSFLGKWRTNFLAFAELFGEANVLLFDLTRPSHDGTGFAVFEGNVHDPIEYWPTASENFHRWLDHLITAQGDKYWTWR